MVVIRFPDPEYAETFRSYSNYVVDLASEIGGLFGWSESLVEGVIDGVALHASGLKLQRRRLNASELDALERALRKSWGDLRRLRSEVDDLDNFDEDSNAWLPVQAYYAVYKAILAFAVASGQQVPRDHRAALSLASKEVVAGRFPYPWSVYCRGCPQTGSVSFGGLSGHAVGSVHVLSRPDPASSSDRVAMFLRTTRQKELERRFLQERSKGVRPGRSRRNLSRADKDRLAGRLPATTTFDLFWRLRTKANYDDADAFSLGVPGRDVGDSGWMSEDLLVEW